MAMTTVEEIEQAVAALSSAERRKFRAWFEEFDAELFDLKIEHDAKSGKLEALAATARSEHRASSKSRRRP